MNGGHSLTEPKLLLKEDTMFISKRDQPALDCTLKQFGEGRKQADGPITIGNRRIFSRFQYWDEFG
jgi:hypothetical protein